jgi:uncharacterized protein with von Willebrand factor type A (vWA) domain
MNARFDPLRDNGARPRQVDYGNRLLERLVEFGRLLWEMGLDVGPRRLIEAADALALIDVTRRADFYQALKCMLLSHHEQEPLFDEAFAFFWRRVMGAGAQQESGFIEVQNKRNPFRLPPSRRRELEEEQPRRSPFKQVTRMAHESHSERHWWDDRNEEDEEGEERQGIAYSATELLRRKDFEAYTWEEMQEAKRMMAEQCWHLGERRVRRRVPARKGQHLDMRRMLRRSMRHGSEPIQLAWRRPKRKPRPLVIICDISGSMSLYSRLLLHFAHTISNGLENVETFVFGTRLTRITRQLRRRDVDEAVRDVSQSVQDWSGGTRIGEALEMFNYRWARRVLGRGAVVIIISDGWDRGDPEQLRVEMDRLQRSCHRLIWLNPLLGSVDYRPVTVGMRTALPFIDDFLPAHNLASLMELGRVLEHIAPGRPVRLQAARRAVQAGMTHTRVG